VAMFGFVVKGASGGSGIRRNDNNLKKEKQTCYIYSTS
jgi:hypothetical protein